MTPPPPSSAPHGLSRRTQRALDGLAVVALLAWGARQFPSDVALLAGRVVSEGDRYLFGPDAAEWAGSALAFHEGRWADLDFHRMPTFSVVVGVLLHTGIGTAEVMHLWNRMSFWLLGPVLYALGARSGSRAAGFGAGLLIAVAPKLLESTRAAGVDPTILFLLPTMLLVASATARRWYLAPLAGVVSAFATVAHYTTLPFLVPALLLTLVRGAPRWRRWAGLVLHAATAALVFHLLFRVFPFPDRNQLGQAIQEGVQQGTVVGPALSRWDVVTEKLRTDYAAALIDGLGTVLPVFRLKSSPADLYMAAVGLGALGLFHRPLRPEEEASPRAPWWRRWGTRLWRGQEPTHGLVLLLCLAPLPVLAAVDAPERYSYNLVPLVLLLAGRGIAGVLGGIDALVTLWAPRWPSGALALVVAGATAAAVGSQNAYELQIRPPPGDAVSAAVIGEALAERFSPGGGASVPLREAAIGVNRVYCPHSDCPRNQSDEELRRCLLVMDQECGGEGDIPYVVLRGPNPELSRPSRQWLDDFVRANFGPGDRVDAGQYAAEIFRIPRERAREMAKGHEKPPQDEHSVPPPPDPSRPPGPP